MNKVKSNKPANVPDEVPIPENEFDEYVEWTPEEEEEFLRIVDHDDDMFQL